MKTHHSFRWLIPGALRWTGTHNASATQTSLAWRAERALPVHRRAPVQMIAGELL
jgi:hypothetical protein